MKNVEKTVLSFPVFPTVFHQVGSSAFPYSELILFKMSNPLFSDPGCTLVIVIYGHTILELCLKTAGNM